MTVSDLPAGPASVTARDGRGVLRRWLLSPWPWVCVALVVIAFLILLWARTSPGYDPYGWLDWGYQTLHGSLSLRGAPSWKPITFLFTLPYSLLGHLSWWCWRVTELAFALGGPVAGGVLAFRLVRRPGEPVWPALIGGLFAGVGVVMIVQYWHYVLSSQSDPMLVTFTLLAVNAWVTRRYGWAVTCLVAAGLGRPEDWIILGPLGLWVFVTQRRLRLLMVLYALVMALLWFGVPVLTGAPWDVAQKLAQNSVRELHHNKFIGTLGRFLDLSEWPALIAAAGTFVWALLRRDWRVAGVGVVAILWMVIEEYFVLSEGFPGVPRYMFEAAADTVVLGGVGVGWLARLAFNSSAALIGPEAPVRPGADPARRGTGGRHWLMRGIAGACALALVAFMVPDAKAGWDWEHRDLSAERARSHSIYLLSRTIQAAGGASAVRACGVPTTDVGAASILAWYTHLNTSQVGYLPALQIHLGGPVVLFTALPGGWVMHTYNESRSAPARCHNLDREAFVETPADPRGATLHLSS